MSATALYSDSPEIFPNDEPQLLPDYSEKPPPRSPHLSTVGQGNGENKDKQPPVD